MEHVSVTSDVLISVIVARIIRTNADVSVTLHSICAADNYSVHGRCIDWF